MQDHPSAFTIAVLFALVLITGSPALAQPSSQTRAAVDGVLADYELIRAGLAGDDASGVAAAARRIERRATALRSSGGPVAARMNEVVRAASRLARIGASDLAAVRRGFGTLSRPLVSLLDEVPQLAVGRHVFECPMAEGYGRWIQPTAELRNPYMGQRMLSCGRRVE